MRGLVFGVIGLAACAPAKEDCPPGTLGCPCLDDDGCNPGFECRTDVCRDDEDPTGTSTSTSTGTSTTSPSTTEPPPPTSTDGTSIGPGTVGPVSSDPTIDPTATSGDGVCACGWSDAANRYACGFDLPMIGPVGKGSPNCISAGFGGEPCDSVDPPIEPFGCCGGGGSLVVWCQDGVTVIDSCTVVAPGLCEPA